MIAVGRIRRLVSRAAHRLHIAPKSIRTPHPDRSIEQRYERLCSLASDIHEHLPTLRQLASECDLVVEFGTWTCKSTTALLLGARRKVISCDHLIWGNLDDIKSEIEHVRKLARGKFEFICIDTRTPGIFTECDFLFIDTYHNCKQLRAELAVHGNKARKYLAFHDTVTYGKKGDDHQEGLQFAIDEFLAANPHWQLHAFYPNNNGLTVLKRMG